MWVSLAQTICPLSQYGHHSESFSDPRRLTACAVVAISVVTWRLELGQR